MICPECKRQYGHLKDCVVPMLQNRILYMLRTGYTVGKGKTFL